MKTTQLPDCTIASALSGRLIVFEGPDGSGKTTLVAALAAALRGYGVHCERTAFPGCDDKTLGKLVHEIHHQTDNRRIEKIVPTSLQALHVAAHIDAIEQRILPALRKGICVLLDRFWWSTWVYGRVAGVSPKSLRLLLRLEQLHWAGIRPHVVFLLSRNTHLLSGPLLSVDHEYVRLAKQQAKLNKVAQLPNDHDVQTTCELALRVLLDRRPTRPPRPSRALVVPSKHPDTGRGSHVPRL